MQTSQPVELSLINAAGVPPTSGILLETSDNGMLLQLAAPVAYGAEVKLETCGTVLLATVVRCQPDGQRYRIGVRLHESLAKSLSIMEE